MNNLMELKDIFKENPAIFYMLDEVEQYIGKLNNTIKSERDIRLKAIEYCKELMLFKKNSRQYLIGKCMLEKLSGVDKE